MTTAVKLDEKCGHGLVAWMIDGFYYHERAEQTATIDGTRQKSSALHVDNCERPAGEGKAKGSKR